MHRTARILIACSLWGACAGCGDGEENQPTQTAPFEGVTLKIAVPAGHDLRTRWRIELDEWSARSGAAYEWHEYELADAAASPSQQPKPAVPDRDAGLLLFPMTSTASLRLAPLPDGMQAPQNLHFADLFEGLRQGPASIAGKPAVLPLSAPVLVYYYRRDLLERAGLSPPETWEQHLKLLGELDAQNLAAVEPWNERFRATMFLARAVAYAKHPHQYSLFFHVETGEPLIDGPGFVRALKESREALDLMRKRSDVLALSPADCRSMLLAGTAAVAVSLETISSEPTSNAPDRALPESAQIGCVRLPGNPTAYNRSTSQWETPRDAPLNRCTLTGFGGLCAGVSADASGRAQQAAWELLSQIAVDTGTLIRAFPPQTRSPCRESQLARPDAWVAGDLSSGEAQQYVKAVAASLRDPQLVAELPVIGRERYRDALTRGIGRFLADEATAEEALAAVADEWRSISSDLGPQPVLNSYRRSIGLLPRE